MSAGRVFYAEGPKGSAELERRPAIGGGWEYRATVRDREGMIKFHGDRTFLGWDRARRAFASDCARIWPLEVHAPEYDRGEPK